MATVLLVDDDPTILVVTQAALKGAGHDVLAFDDPARAMEELEGKIAFDAAVLDVMMPGHSGYDLLNYLRSGAETRSLPVLFLSSLDSAPERIRGLREGADDYLGKPFEPEELVLRVDRLVERAASATAAAPADPEPEEGKLGRYEVLEVLGEGSMGTVFRGWDPKLQRAVALKTVKLDLAGSSLSRGDLVSRLLHEAVMGARCSHPNIVSIFDVEDSPRAAFIAMEYVKGPSLELYLSYRDPVPQAEVIYMAAQVAQALAAAHASELVHHDIKPGNVMLGADGSVKVTDFGLANWISVLAETSGRVFGTPGFLAPEALRGDGYTRSSDLFGLGAVMYRCLTGRQAFPGKTIAGVVANTLGGSVEAPSTLVAGLKPELDELVRALLAKEPDERPPGAREVALRLEAMVEGPPPQWPRDLRKLPAPETSSTDLGRSRMIELATLAGGPQVLNPASG